MTNQPVVRTEQDDQVRKELPEWLRGLSNWLGIKLSGDNVKDVNIRDDVSAVVKTPLGSMAAVSGATSIHIGFNTEAQILVAEGEKIIAEGRRDAERALGDARAKALVRDSRRGQTITTGYRPTRMPRISE